MIKFYCDKCGKEITGHVNEVVEKIGSIDENGNEMDEWRNEIFYYCDECQYNDLTCGFKVGDQVITSTGKVGTITDICTCDQCKDRGFYEPSVKVEVGTGSIWITNNDKRHNFKSFYKIGDQIFGNIDKQCVLDDIERKKEEIIDNQKELLELRTQLKVINRSIKGGYVT